VPDFVPVSLSIDHFQKPRWMPWMILYRMDRNYLAHRLGDFNNAVLAAAGYNFRRLIRSRPTSIDAFFYGARRIAVGRVILREGSLPDGRDAK
jgi:hypothetical protein